MIGASEQNKLDVLSLNLNRGGFDAYDPTQALPSREVQIRRILHQFRDSSPKSSAVSLVDAYRWGEVYGGEIGIAAHLGYQSARFIEIDDERLRQKGEDGIGIVFATDRRIGMSEPLDLGTRQNLRTILDIGSDGLQFVSVYLDDLSEDTRRKQARALVSGLEAGVPTILAGDFNALRPTLSGASIDVKARDFVVRSLAVVMPKRTLLGKSIKGMNQRQVVPIIESLGYKDADSRKRPTAPSYWPAFGIDYVFHNAGVRIDDFGVMRERRASDHNPFTFTAHVS